MEIKITETYEPSYIIDEWKHNIYHDDLGIIITKNLTDELIDLFTNPDSAWYWEKQCSIIHITCTGFGGTILEPRAYSLELQHAQALKLVRAGYPIDRLVLRLDPIFPNDFGLFVAEKVLLTFKDTGIKRCRVSVLDLYNHVIKRLRNCKDISEEDLRSKLELNLENIILNNFVETLLDCYYENGYQHFTARKDRFKIIDEFLNLYKDDYHFEKCCEPNLNTPEFRACVSDKDLKLNNITETVPTGHQRVGCYCLQKKQLIPRGMSRGRCPNKCLYCYLKDKDEK